MDKSSGKATLFPRIYALVRKIPAGQVSTYGHVAALVGPPCDARMVGWAMASLPDRSDVPWQRVINSQGKISLKGMSAQQQRQRLELEGIAFDARGRVDLKRFEWHGPTDWWTERDAERHEPSGE